MNAAQSRRVVLLSVLVMLAINTYRGNLSTNDTTVTKRLWGTGMLAVMLGFLSDIAPQVAGPFAALAALGLVSKSGDAAFNNLLGKASGRVAAPPGVTGPQTPSPSRPGTAPKPGSSRGEGGPSR